MSSNTPATSLRSSLALTLVMIAMSERTVVTAAAAAPQRPVETTNPGHVTCSTPIQHPLRVVATPLGAIERGVPLRIRVTTTAMRGLDRGEVRLTSSGGASLVGASRAALGAVPAGGQVASEFTVLLPTSGHRFLLQFEVSGEGASRNLTRGATLNLLPDGPAEHLRAAATGSGERLLEVRAGRTGQ